MIKLSPWAARHLLLATATTTSTTVVQRSRPPQHFCHAHRIVGTAPLSDACSDHRHTQNVLLDLTTFPSCHDCNDTYGCGPTSPTTATFRPNVPSSTILMQRLLGRHTVYIGSAVSMPSSLQHNASGTNSMLTRTVMVDMTTHVGREYCHDVTCHGGVTCLSMTQGQYSWLHARHHTTWQHNFSLRDTTGM